MKKLLLLSLAVALLAGCALSDSSASYATRPAAMCTGCGEVWVASNGPAGKPGSFPMGRKHWHRVCPICVQMAQIYFKTGAMGQACPQCGNKLKACLVELRPAPTEKSP